MSAALVSADAGATTGTGTGNGRKTQQCVVKTTSGGFELIAKATVPLAGDGSGLSLSAAVTVTFNTDGTFSQDLTVSEGRSLILEATSSISGGVLSGKEVIKAPIQGIREVTWTFDGTLIHMTIDGRVVVPFVPSQNFSLSTLRFEDGGPLPEIHVPASLEAALPTLMQELADEAKTCTSPPTSTMLVSDPEGGHVTHTADTLDCLACGAACQAADVACIAAVVGTACVALPLVGCVLGAATAPAACTALDAVCMGRCWTNGGLCCPHQCIDQGFESMSSACCAKDEQCLDPGISELCCSAGTTPCNGQNCCFNDSEKCISSGPNAGTCCPTAQICGNVCCEQGSVCGNPSSQTCCGALTFPCGTTCCLSDETCVAGTCVSPPCEQPCTQASDCAGLCHAGTAFCDSSGCCGCQPT